jgi:hypothetical protein
MSDWDEVAVIVKREAREHGGFVTMQRDAFRERFGIGRLTEKSSEDLVATLSEHGLLVFPRPYLQGTTLRVYDVESDVGKIVLAIVEPQNVSERALVDTVNLHARANAGKDRRSDDVPWLSALDVYLQLVIGRPPEGWEDLQDEREPYQLVAALAASLEIPTDVVDSKELVRVAGAVCACRPHGPRWEGAPRGLGVALAEAARKQKDIFDGVLREAAKHLLGGGEIPSRDVELGRLGLRYRREAQGGIGWLR